MENKIFTISNLLSISRIFIAPIIIVLLQKSQDSYNILILFLMGLGILTDYLDGYLARKRNETSTLGKILDPLADKISIGLMVIALISLRNFPLWLAVTILGRDLLILLASLFVIKRKKLVIPSNLIGKATVVALAGLVIAYVINAEQFKQPLIILSVLLLIISTFSYLIGFIKTVKQ
jgi:CDP-diacylglycerol--glycerol-3-phosphate 3-phosphatidyltransferase